MPDNYFNYFTEIEEYFVRMRGRNLLIAPLDWCLIELWKDHQIPLHVVLRGIDRSFESAARRRRRAPSTLFYCHPAVMEAYEEYRTAMVGSEGEEFDAGTEQDLDLPKSQVLSHLDRLLREIEEKKSSGIERALNRLSAVRSEVEISPEIDLPGIDKELQQIASSMVEDLREQLSRDELKRFKTECRKELKIYRKHVSKEVFDQLQAKQLEKKLWEHHGLPDFSLLSVRMSSGVES